ncbi:hypothetical protein QF034_003315 [Streptomyces africanus]|uniref:Uncharacterized protein n=1 Tax=Streptomyces africanus TaxID=231024 RepID=A0ABU0QR94_9ACTN|nr:hypothetical protein [Streptomyces africanus]MDQ0749084.1 hypothetical protein [Streptomyces africanus]
MARPAIAVVAPLTGPCTESGAILLAQVERVKAAHPGLADWHVHDEARGGADAVARGGYVAVIGHCVPEEAQRALRLYESAGVLCLLPFVRAPEPALSWAPDEDGLARTIVRGAIALGATSLAVTHDPARRWATLAERVTGTADAAGLPRTNGPDTALALLVPQNRLSAALRMPPRRPVLVVADCGRAASFGALVNAWGDRPVWAVHPGFCLAQRAATAATALAEALADDPALHGPALAAAVFHRSGTVLAPGGGVLGEGWFVSRLDAVCPPHG